MKKNKGFTLIELLAIIVILAIIAVITVPIILNIIETSQKGAVTDSAYGYKDAINKFYVSKLAQDKDFEMDDGTYTTAELKNLGVSLSGKEPDENSWVTLENNNVTNGCLQFDEYKVDIENGKVTNTEKGECEEYIEFNGTYVAPFMGDESSEADTHKGIVYMDPTNLSTTCNETNYNTTPLAKTGCMKFYIFSEDEKTVTMILNHNTTKQISFAKTGDIDEKHNFGYYSYHGPREALYQLYEDTKDWSGVPDLKEKDNYTLSWDSHSYTIDYTKHLESPTKFTYVEGAHKARFITAEEIAQITGKLEQTPDWNPITFTSSFSFDQKNGVTINTVQNERFYWLVENMYDNLHGIQESEINNPDFGKGYWTASSSTSSRTKTAWYVQIYGLGCSVQIDNDSYMGIRPVITVPKSVLGIN